MGTEKKASVLVDERTMVIDPFPGADFQGFVVV